MNGQEYMRRESEMSVYESARQVERMSPEQLAVLRRDLEPLATAFNPDSDVGSILLGINAEQGITGWSVEHIRGLRAGEPVQPQEAEKLTQVSHSTHGSLPGIGDFGLNFLHPHGTECDADRVLQGVYERLLSLIEVPGKRLVTLTLPPRPELELYEVPEIETDVYTLQGPAWDRPVVIDEGTSVSIESD